MELFYRLAADFIVVFHLAYVLFIVIGLLLILVGKLRGWEWVHRFWFRAIHLTMILIVVVESWLGIVCPLTTWEKQLRTLAGQTTYEGDFIANWVHDLLFFDLSPATFTLIYSAFGGLVLLSLFWVRPRWPFKGKGMIPESSGS